MSGTDRRGFVRGATLAGVAFAFPGAEWLDRLGAESPAPSRTQDPWEALRGEFLISPRGIYLNTGTVGASPRAVVNAVMGHLTAFETVFEAQGLDIAALRRALGDLIGAPPHTLVFTRNTTEAINWVANGLELERGDVIVMTDQEHLGGQSPWELVARRRGLDIVKVPLPVPARSQGEVMDRWLRSIPPRARVAMITHVVFANGLIQPVRELCDALRRRGIITVIDGAHPPGLLRLDVTSIGCDFYCASPHKWLLAPKGTGLLYISDAWLDRLWPTVASGGWDDLSLRAERFDRMGTRNDSLLVGLRAAVEFHEGMGRERVERRTRELGDRLYAGLVRLDGVEVKSPSDASIRAPLISFARRGMTGRQIVAELWRRGPVRVRHVSEHGLDWVRLSTHVYNTPEEVDRAVSLVREL